VSPFAEPSSSKRLNPEEEEENSVDNDTNDTEMLKSINDLLDLGKQTFLPNACYIDLLDNEKKVLPPNPTDTA